MKDALNTTRKWTTDHARKAAEEGWVIYTAPSGEEKIGVHDTEGGLADDEQAIAHVYHRAGEASDLHRLALNYTLRPENCKPPAEQKMHKVFVYGTLRTHGQPTADPIQSTHTLVGYDMFDTGAYPYIVFNGDGIVYGNVLDVNDSKLAYLDNYEGVARGLYTRETVTVEPLDGSPPVEVFVYVASTALNPPLIESGDWFVHSAAKYAKAAEQAAD